MNRSYPFLLMKKILGISPLMKRFFQEIIVGNDNQIPNITKGSELTQPKLHTIPRGVVSLENLFDLREKFKKPKNTKISSSCTFYEVINLGTIDNPRNINLRRSISPEEKKAYLRLFKYYQDRFAWSYQYLKTYDTRIIQNNIPLRPKVKPFH